MLSAGCYICNSLQLIAERLMIAMPEFTNPFPGVVPRKMSHAELIRAIMLDIAAELEAVHVYTSHMDATDNQDAKKLLHDIALEELVHAGEFTHLLNLLDPVTATKVQEGIEEATALLAGQGSPGEEGGEETVAEEESGSPAPRGFTVGSLIGQGD